MRGNSGPRHRRAATVRNGGGPREYRAAMLRSAGGLDFRRASAGCRDGAIWARRASGRAARDCKPARSEEHTSGLPSLMRNSYAGFCFEKKKNKKKRVDVYK